MDGSTCRCWRKLGSRITRDYLDGHQGAGLSVWQILAALTCIYLSCFLRKSDGREYPCSIDPERLAERHRHGGRPDPALNHSKAWIRRAGAPTAAALGAGGGGYEYAGQWRPSGNNATRGDGGAGEGRAHKVQAGDRFGQSADATCPARRSMHWNGPC